MDKGSSRAAALWQRVVDELRGEISAITLSTFFEGANGVDITHDTLVVGCEGTVARDWITQNHRAAVEQKLAGIMGSPYMIKCLGGEDEVKRYLAQNAPAEAASADAAQGDTLKGDVPKGTEYTFGNFVVGASNRFAHAAAQAVAEGDAAGYNPLFIYGGSGLGKTHLMYAIANVRRKKNSKAKIVYVRGEVFTNELIEAIRGGTIRSGKEKEFREKYRTADLFLMDDIHFIAGKEATQEEFFNTFNALYEAGKQIIVTSDRPPKEMARLEERLRTRFEWGLVADIQPPDLETRAVIIRNKANSLGLEMSDQVVMFIAENITANVRQLEGVVKKVQAYATLMREKPSIDTATKAISDVFTEKLAPTAELIVDETERFFDLEPGALSGKRRDSRTAHARQVAVYLIRTMTRLSFPEIGRVLGRHHTTIMYSVEQVAALRKADQKADSDIRDLIFNIESK